MNLFLSCNCKSKPPPVNENQCKFEAKIMLCDIRHKIVIPTPDEWIGLNLLERDDELVRGQEQRHIG